MSISPQKRPSAGIVAPVGYMLGSKILSFARSRLPVPKPRTRRRAFLAVAPIPFAPLIDTHAFQPPPPYSVYADGSAHFLPVPHNTPEERASTVAGDRSASMGSCARPVGLGLEGVEKGEGGRFDGLGRLSGGVRASGGATSDTLREHVHQMLTERARRRRTWANERPTTCHDVFYASVDAQATRSVPARTVALRARRRSVASPTPGARWEGVSRGTISSELKRAASLARRASLSATMHTTWRV